METKAFQATKSLVLSGLMCALMTVSKQAMSGLPNIEPVSLLVLVFTLELPRQTVGAVAAFAVVQGLLYGFNLYWVAYLYIWYVLMLAVWLLRRMDNAALWALVSGLFGLCFGALYAPLYLFAGGPGAALAWWLAGLQFDLLHAGGNFILALLLYHPLRRALQLSRRQAGL